MLSEAEAIEAAAEDFGDSALDVRAQRLGGTSLWAVNAFDEFDRPWAGSFTIVGPDSRVWSFSSNPSIHDPKLVVAVLARLYEQSLTEQVSTELLSDRLAKVTAEREQQTRGIVNAAAAGELRPSRPRVLP